MTVKDLYDFLDGFAAFGTKAGWDNAGLLVGDYSAVVNGVLVTLDVTPGEVEYAVKSGVNTIVSHHPIIFRPIKKVTADSPVYLAIANGINIISAHTNLDKAVGGVNDALCEKLGMDFVKEDETVAEGFINTGMIAGIETPEALAEHISKKLGASVRYIHACDKIEKTGVCSGAGGDFVAEAARVGCNAFITGDASYHEFLDAADMGVSLFAAGHFETENMITEVLADKISARFGDIPVLKSERPLPVKTIQSN